MNINWMRRLQLIGGRSLIKPWYVDSTRGWSRHVEVTRFVKVNAKKIYNSLGSKLKQMRESDGSSYEELVKCKRIYHDIKEVYDSKSKSFLSSTSHKSE